MKITDPKQIEFGSIEYFELLSLRDKLKFFRYGMLMLENLDRLRAEIDQVVEHIHAQHKKDHPEKYKKNEEPNR